MAAGCRNGSQVARIGSGRRWKLLGCVAAVALVASVLANNVTITGGIAGVEGRSLRIYHVVLASLGVGLLSSRGLVRWRPEVTWYLSTLTISATVAAFFYPAQPLLLNWVVAVYAFCVAATLGRAIGPDRCLLAMRIAFGVVLAAAIAKLWAHRLELVVYFAAPDAHPRIPTFINGGVNVEASLLGLGAALFVGSRWFWPYVITQLALSAIYASRTGFIAAGLMLLLAGARAFASTRQDPMARRRLGRLVVGSVLVIGLLAIVIGALAAHQSGIGYVIQRFTSIGDDPGSMGRLTLWLGALELYPKHPFGVGIGNATLYLQRELGLFLPENNLHNQYLQHLVELGLQGLAAWLLLVGVTLRRTAADGWRDPVLRFMVGYFALSAIQYGGADAIVWAMLGLQHGALAYDRPFRATPARPAELGDAASVARMTRGLLPRGEPAGGANA